MTSMQSLYDYLIELERYKFRVLDENLDFAIDNLREVYSRRSLHYGDTYLDYNNPCNRIAYLMKFGALHALFTIRYFHQLLRQRSVINLLNSKQTLKICCLGGGPGTDVAAIFTELAGYSQMQGKIDRVTILDICGGWRNSFNVLMDYITCSGGGWRNFLKKFLMYIRSWPSEDVPTSFVSTSEEFEAELIQVNLLQPLSSRVADVIAEADVVTMVKFMSAVIGNYNASSAFEDIGNILKPGAILLLIDNQFEEKEHQFLQNFHDSCDLQAVMGPTNGSYENLRVSVLGFMKRGGNVPRQSSLKSETRPTEIPGDLKLLLYLFLIILLIIWILDVLYNKLFTSV